MAIIVDAGFRITSAQPADLKYTWTTTHSLYQPGIYPICPVGYISSSWRYEGMIVYCEDDQSHYQLLGGIEDINWVKLLPAVFI